MEGTEKNITANFVFVFVFVNMVWLGCGKNVGFVGGSRQGTKVAGGGRQVQSLLYWGQAGRLAGGPGRAWL